MIDKLYLYYLIFNIFCFALMGYDKRQAKKHAGRVPEKNIFMLALLGGALGVYFGMQVFRHKTKHLTFKLGIPVIFMINIAIAMLLKGYRL